MAQYRTRKPRPPINRDSLNEIALAYVGRFATTRSKLSSYLLRKVRERGWAGPESENAVIAVLVERFASTGLVDDRAFANARANSLIRRGYGVRRLAGALSAAGVDAEDSREALDHCQGLAVESALRFAERRRIGPFAIEEPSDQEQRRKSTQRAIAAMVRAGHPLELSVAIVSRAPGDVPGVAELS